MEKRLAWYLYAKQDLKNANVLHATSELELQELRALGVRQPIALIPNGVSALDAIPEPKELPNRPYCLFMSRIHEKKGIRELLDVWCKLNLSNWDLVIAGPDEQGMMNRMKLQPNIRYVGAVSGVDKSRLLHGASIFVLPTYSENFGVVVAESLLAGVPVITTFGAPWGGLVENHCGWWIPITKEALYEAMSKATSLPKTELREMGRRGARWVESEFNWSTIGKQMSSVYEWISGLLAEPPECVRTIKPANK